MIRAILKEYGISWAFDRVLYSMKLRMMRAVPATEKLFEKKRKEVIRTDIFETDVNVLQKFIRNLPLTCQNELIQNADHAIEGRIMAFSSIQLDYGNPVNWQLNPLTGKCTDQKKKWYHIPDFDKERGDIKVIWEISRFSHFPLFARAYLLTENQKYYRAFSKQLQSWVKQNPYSYGANYKCGQECALRMINALFAYAVFTDKKLVTAEDAKNMKELVLGCYQKILSNFFYAHKCIKNNHTLSELLGMIVGAWCCGDEKQLKKAYRYLEKEIREQFSEDGGYTQHSFNYQRLALQVLDVIISISAKTGKKLSGECLERIKNSAFLLYQCQAQNGDLPNYGSNDGALVFPLTSCGYRDFRPVIDTTYALTTGHTLYKNGIYSEELIWMGKTNLLDSSTIAKEQQSCAFEKAGIFTLRQEDSYLMMVANNYKKRPAHMDQLHVDLWVGDVNVLCDSGTYSYASDLGKFLIKNESHNTVCFNQAWQMNQYGNFMIYDWTARKGIDWSEDYMEGRVESKNGYIHKRRIEKTEDGFLIKDRVLDVKGRTGIPYQIRFHTICEVQAFGNRIDFRKDGKFICSMETDAEYEIHSAKRSLYYLQDEEISCIIIKDLTSEETIEHISKIRIGAKEEW